MVIQGTYRKLMRMVSHNIFLDLDFHQLSFLVLLPILETLIVKLFAVMLRLVVQQDVLWLVPAIYRAPDLVRPEPDLPSTQHT